MDRRSLSLPTKQLSKTVLFLVDMYAWRTVSQWVKHHLAKDLTWPTELLSNLAVALLEQQEDRSKVANIEKEVSEYCD